MEEELLVQMLKALRMDIARELKMPPYVVYHNSAIENLVKNRPQSIEELGKIKGFGSSNIEKYGERILDVLKNGYPLKEKDNNVIPELKTEVNNDEQRKKKEEKKKVISHTNENYVIDFPHLWRFISPFVEEQDERRKDILIKFAEGNSMEEIAIDYSLSTERIRQLIVKGLAATGRVMAFRSKKYKALQEENEKLKLQLDECIQRINDLEKYAPEQDRCLIDENVYLSRLNVSNRLAHIFERGNLKTMSQLCRITKREFLSIPGAGRKTLGEVLKLLEERNLGFMKDIVGTDSEEPASEL